MEITLLKSKLHRATVTEANLNYVGSITIAIDLMEAGNIYEYEKVQVVCINNGNRFETYTIAGERGSGVICLNGAAARCVQPGDLVIVMTYANMTPLEASKHIPKVVLMNSDNSIDKIIDYEKHGTSHS